MSSNIDVIEIGNSIFRERHKLLNYFWSVYQFEGIFQYWKDFLWSWIHVTTNLNYQEFMCTWNQTKSNKWFFWIWINYKIFRWRIDRYLRFMSYFNKCCQIGKFIDIIYFYRDIIDIIIIPIYTDLQIIVYSSCTRHFESLTSATSEPCRNNLDAVPNICFPARVG